MTERLKALNPRLTEVLKNTDDWQDWHDLADDAHEKVADHLEQALGDEPVTVPERAEAPAVRPSNIPAD